LSRDDVVPVVWSSGYFLENRNEDCDEEDEVDEEDDQAQLWVSAWSRGNKQSQGTRSTEKRQRLELVILATPPTGCLTPIRAPPNFVSLSTVLVHYYKFRQPPTIFKAEDRLR